MLGIILDTQLRWKPHVQEIQNKMKTVTQALSRLTASTWGASLLRARHIYKAVILPSITYGSTIWHEPDEILNYQRAKMQIQKLSVIQNKQMRMIAGAFKATPIPELKHETGIPPIDIHLSAQSLRYQTS
jgi:hypothetical protein